MLIGDKEVRSKVYLNPPHWRFIELDFFENTFYKEVWPSIKIEVFHKKLSLQQA